MTLIKYKGLEVDPSKLNETIQINSSSLGALSLQESDSGENFIMPRIESIHAGRTANHVFYPADKLKGDKKLGSGVYSWTEPYAKPVIYNHDMSTEVTGRVVRAAYSEYTQAGVPGIIVVPKITQKEAVEAVRDGRLLTVSIGAETNSAVCSICGTDIINEGYCGHMKGEEYDGHTAEWIVGDLFFQELSWVNQPADSNAFVVDSDINREVAAGDAKESKGTQSMNEYYGIPKAYALTESVAVNMSEKEDIPKVGKNKALEELKKATQGAQELLESVNIDIQPATIKAGESIVLENTGDEIPEGATIEVSNEEFVVELNEEREIVLTAPEEIEETSVDMTISVKTENTTTSVAFPLTIEVQEAVDSETDKEKSETDETETADEDKEKGKEETDETDSAEADEANKEKDSAITEAVETIQTLQGVNQLLKEQVQLLTSKLRESYVDKIIAKHDGELSEEYINRLKTRKLESLEETVEDLESGFLKVKAKEQKARTVTKVTNPLAEKDETKDIDDKKEVTEQDKVDLFKSFLKLK